MKNIYCVCGMGNKKAWNYCPKCGRMLKEANIKFNEEELIDIEKRFENLSEELYFVQYEISPKKQIQEIVDKIYRCDCISKKALLQRENDEKNRTIKRDF